MLSAQRISSALIAKSNKAGRIRVCFEDLILAFAGEISRVYEGRVAVRTVKIAQNIASSRGSLVAPARKAKEYPLSIKKESPTLYLFKFWADICGYLAVRLALCGALFHPSRRSRRWRRPRSALCRRLASLWQRLFGLLYELPLSTTRATPRLCLRPRLTLAPFYARARLSTPTAPLDPRSL